MKVRRGEERKKAVKEKEKREEERKRKDGGIEKGDKKGRKGKAGIQQVNRIRFGFCCFFCTYPLYLLLRSSF